MTATPVRFASLFVLAVVFGVFSASPFASAEVLDHQSGAGEVVIPVPRQRTTGAVPSYRVVTDDTDPADVPDLSEVEGDVPGGLTFGLDSCRQLAPLRWRFSGPVTLPDTSQPANVLVAVQFSTGDIGSGTLVLARVERSGRYHFDVDAQDFYRGDDEDHSYGVNPRADGFSWCSVSLYAADVPASESGGGTKPRLRSRPVRWTAPKGTFQALGQRRSLAEGRNLAFTYHNWNREPLPFETVFVPRRSFGPVQRLDARYSPDDPCVTLTIASETNRFRQRKNCRSLGEGSPSTVKGFEWVNTDGGTSVLVGYRRGFELVIESDHGTKRAERIARGIKAFPNLFHELPQFDGTFDRSLDGAITTRLSADGPYEERARFTVGDQVFVAAAGSGILTEDEDYGDVPVYSSGIWIFERQGPYWVGQADGGTAGSEQCIRRSGNGSPGLRTHQAIAYDPSWRIQIKHKGQVEELPTTNGVLFEVGRAWRPGLMRAVDAQGNPIECADNFVLPGETTVPWIPPTAEVDLPVTADVVKTRTDGLRIDFSGDDFYPDRFVELWVCTANPAPWYITEGCAWVSGQRSDENGSVTFRRFIPWDTPLYPTEPGIPEDPPTIDCRNGCTATLRSNFGLTRSGQTPLPARN